MGGTGLAWEVVIDLKVVQETPKSFCMPTWESNPELRVKKPESYRHARQPPPLVYWNSMAGISLICQLQMHPEGLGKLKLFISLHSSHQATPALGAQVRSVPQQPMQSRTFRCDSRKDSTFHAPVPENSDAFFPQPHPMLNLLIVPPHTTLRPSLLRTIHISSQA